MAITDNLDKITSFISEDIQKSHSSDALNLVFKNLEEITVQKVLDCRDERFLKVYQLLQEIIKSSTKLDLSLLNDQKLRELISDANIIEDAISLKIEEINTYRESQNSGFLIQKAKIDLDKILSNLLRR